MLYSKLRKRKREQTAGHMRIKVPRAHSFTPVSEPAVAPHP